MTPESVDEFVPSAPAAPGAAAAHTATAAHPKVSPHPLWVLPFVLLLLSIALFPLLAPHFWEHQYPIVAGTLFAVAFAYYAFVRFDLHPWLH